MTTNKLKYRIPKKELCKDKIFLLSKEEADELPLKILRLWHWWWLRSPGCHKDYATYIYEDGSLFNLGGYVDNDFGGVRPAILLNGSEELEKLGDMIYYLGIEWHDLSRYLGRPIILAKDYICYRNFDDKSNNYKKSEIRQFLLNWLEKKEKEFSFKTVE